MEDDALSRIEQTQVEPETVKGIFHAAADGPEALAKAYACSMGSCPPLIPMDTVKRMTTHDWAVVQRQDSVLNKVIRLYERKNIDTTKVGYEEPMELQNLITLPQTQVERRSSM